MMMMLIMMTAMILDLQFFEKKAEGRSEVIRDPDIKFNDDVDDDCVWTKNVDLRSMEQFLENTGLAGTSDNLTAIC
jgi:hypothetical protein